VRLLPQLNARTSELLASSRVGSAMTGMYDTRAQNSSFTRQSENSFCRKLGVRVFEHNCWQVLTITARSWLTAVVRHQPRSGQKGHGRCYGPLVLNDYSIVTCQVRQL
jgi:hypothetical protein